MTRPDYVAISDPTLNPQFRRHWEHPPPERREGPTAPNQGPSQNCRSGSNDGAENSGTKLSLQVWRAAEQRRQRRMRHAQIVHSLGWRVTFAAFDQLASDLDEAHVDRLLERFAGLNREILEQLRVNDLPLSPIRVIGATGGAS